MKESISSSHQDENDVDDSRSSESRTQSFMGSFYDETDDFPILKHPKEVAMRREHVEEKRWDINPIQSLLGQGGYASKY